MRNVPSVVHRARRSGCLKGLSVLRENSSGAFLGEGMVAISSSYPTTYCRLSQLPSCWAIQTTRTPERGARKQFIYNISGFYSGFGVVFPGIEAPRSTLQCTFPSFSAKSVHPSVNLPSLDQRHAGALVWRSYCRWPEEKIGRAHV